VLNITLVLLLAFSASLKADFVLTETFDGSVLDHTKWDIYTSPSTPAGTAGSVSVANGTATLANRGTIITKQEFSNGFDLVGRFRFDGVTDRFMVFTRSTGASTNPWKDQDNGIFYNFQQDSGQVGISEWTVGGLSNPGNAYTSDANCWLNALSSAPAYLPSNEWIDFRITDNGSMVALYLGDLANPIVTATTVLSPGNRISFNNSYNPGQVVSIDSVTVASVPEPSALSLLVIGLGGLAMIRSRRL
jgi:hypothetical protein